ncbi:MAG TPA: HEAT repeat domain-containing protein [Thermoanaerobaculia bacterium]|nr:HEAT repeat domain-containing protein [Thermoanaerobaculia bacterium]
MWGQLIIPALELLAVAAIGLWTYRKRPNLPRQPRPFGWPNEAAKAAAACGLQVVETWPTLLARAGPVEVRIGESESSDREVQVAIAAPELSEMRIHRRETVHPYQYSWAPENATGDAQFDSAFFIEGPPALVLAVLDARTRTVLLWLSTRSRLALSLGEVRAEMPPRDLSSTLPYLLEIGGRLAQPLDLARCLAENAHRDPEAGVRLQNLTVLARELPGSPATLEALRAACSDPSPEVRLRAAQELGDELQRAARQAIAEIQSRLPGASPGQLSLAGTEAGQLSLAQIEEGQLSLVPEKAGRLSLPPEGPG